MIPGAGAARKARGSAAPLRGLRGLTNCTTPEFWPPSFVWRFMPQAGRGIRRVDRPDAKVQKHSARDTSTPGDIKSVGWARSNRSGGRLQTVTVGDLRSVRLGDIIGIRSLPACCG